MQSRKLFQVLFMAVLCTALFAVAAFAAPDREDGKGNPGVRATHELNLQRGTGGTVGHWNSVHKFTQTVPSPFGKAADSCSGYCTCDECGCSGSDSCCDAGCSYCWGYLDGRGACGI
jgi:hypothetical protein